MPDGLAGSGSGAFAAYAAEIYRPQLEAYRRATSKLCRLTPDHITVRLLFVEAGSARIL